MNNKGRITLIELVSIIVIVSAGFYFIARSYGWLDSHMSTGNDALYANTALSVAKVNSLDGVDCPVNDCDNPSGECIHYTSMGYVGYFDGETNKIVGNKLKGYNSNPNPVIDDKEYKGYTSTMVIRITCYNGDITLDWVKGEE